MRAGRNPASARRYSTSDPCSARHRGGSTTMSVKHPVIAITGSSGAGTTTVTTTFEQIFRREGVNAVIVEGDAFHRYDRAEMRALIEEGNARGNSHVSHFGPEANLFEE